ncbi:hypothetical protein AGMMS50276_12260 [Synergistales bacterium]|nr:hypothetical protein AGMMS50276_12260 [Synergistales bacterium]
MKDRRGFTLLEVLVVLVVAAIIFGVSVMLVSQGSQITAVNNAYSTAQRAALAAVEFLPKEISVAAEVQIISRDWDHNIKAGISDDWRYIKLDEATNTVVRIDELDGSGNLKLNPLPGSDIITALSFDAVGNKNNQDFRKLVHVSVAARSVPDGKVGADYNRVVSLDRAILVRAPDGVKGEGGWPATWPTTAETVSGKLLRYRMETDFDPEIDLFWSRLGSGLSYFNDPNVYNGRPDTWRAMKNPNGTTHIDAVLKLPRRLKQDTVVFSWIAFAQDKFKTNDLDEKDPAKLLAYLNDHLRPEEWTKIRTRLVAGDVKAIEDVNSDDARISFVQESSFADSPLNMSSSIPADYRGLRLLKLTSGAPKDSNTNYRMENPFNLGAVVSTMMENAATYYGTGDEYNGAYMVVMAHYKEGGAWKDWPVYIRMGDGESDSIFRKIVSALATVPKGQAGRVGNVYVNADVNSATLLAADTSANNGNGMFKVSGGSGANPGKVILEFASEDFSHMVPKDNGAPVEPVMYGSTNYAVYLDATSGASGGYGVFLNGTKVHTGRQNNADYYTSSGYVFQFDPGARGLIMRHYYYNNTTFGELDNRTFGVIPMYFYDAAKGTTNLTSATPGTRAAPGEIAFFKGSAVALEDFGVNAGADRGSSISYRIPFRPVNAYYYQNITRYPTRRDTGELYRGSQDYNWGFYGASGQDAQYMATYTPKLMQSWHNYEDTTVSGLGKTSATLNANGEYNDAYNDDNLLTSAYEKNRHGYRWDYDWGMDTDAQSMWRRRQILKFTVLEVTKDIKQSQIGKDETGQYWQEPIVQLNATYDGTDNTIVHKAGDLFVRLEMIQLRKNPRDPTKILDPNNSRNYVYSKPIWFGKIKGDSWRGDDPSPFKKMGNTMMHVVSPLEPRAGDAQSFRRRGMRVRSWKEAIYGQDFSGSSGSTQTNAATGAVSYRRGRAGGKPFTKDWPPDYENADYTGANDAIWTPPIAVDLNAAPASDNTGYTGTNPTLKNITQPAAGNTTAADVFGQYSYGNGQYVQRERKGASGSYQYAYNGVYTNRMYGRLSLLRPYNAANPPKPLHGLYAMRGWDYGRNGNASAVYDSTGDTRKRFLMVVRGQRMPYNIHQFTPSDAGDVTINNGYYNRESGAVGAYTPDRVRTLAFRFWSSGSAPTLYYDDWIGEGFTPWEVREILGLDPTQYPVFVRDEDSTDSAKNKAYTEADFNNWRAIRKLYIQGNNDNANTGNVDDPQSTLLTALQKAGFYTRPPVNEDDD